MEIPGLRLKNHYSDILHIAYIPYTKMKTSLVLALLLFVCSFTQAQTSEMTTHKYGLIASLKAKEGKTEELGKILLKASELVSTSKGCISYVVSLDAEDEHLLWITEVWDSKADHDASLTNPEVRALIGTAYPCWTDLHRKVRS